MSQILTITSNFTDPVCHMVLNYMLSNNNKENLFKVEVYNV